MGSSTASENTINTSTDSANTLVTLVTTTDGETHDDSLDLIDVAPELSPPPVTEQTSAYNNSNNNNHHNYHHHVTTTIVQNGHVTTASTTFSITNTNSSGSSSSANSSDNLSPSGGLNGHHANGGDGKKCVVLSIPTAAAAVAALGSTNIASDSPNATPPTPLVGSHQEMRFTFNTRELRPALPDLKADFFSQAVRESVDVAGHPEHMNAIAALLAKQQQQQKSSVTNGLTSQNATSTTTTTTSSTTNTNTSQSNNNEKNLIDSSPSAVKTKPNINVTTNPLDMSIADNEQNCTTGARAHARWTGSGVAGTKRMAQATIVVQQPSLTDSPAATILLHQDADDRRREENMRQLLDVANSLTMQDYRDFEMKYGSPHHSRSQSVKTPGSRASGRPNYLCLPQQRSRVASMPNTGVEEEYYRLRHFSINGKVVVNRGDSLKSRRSRSNNSVASSNSSTEHLTASYPGSARNSAAGSLASSRESSASQGPFRVLMLGAAAVGKSSLVSQFMTSEYLHAYDTSIDDESGEKTVSVLLAGEESELTFIDHSSAEVTPESCITMYEPHGYCVVYSTTDASSVRVAEQALQTLWRSDHIPARAVIVVGNKADLARSRTVSTEGKSMAMAYNCKFIETSVGINHNVDELLVGLLTQIRLKLENPERSKDHHRRRSSRRNRSRSPLGSCSENNSPKKFRNSRTSTSLKVRNLLGKVWARDSKSKSCENLHVL